MAGSGSIDLIAEDGLSIHRLLHTDEEYRRLLAWRREPHVRATWDNDDDDGAFSLERIIEHYGPQTDPADVTERAIIELDHRPIGYIQFYPWAAYADEAREMSVPLEGSTWGLDVFIGAPDAVNRGFGSRAVDLLCRYLIEARGATAVALLTELTNDQAQRAYEKAGFVKVREALDLDTRDGERIPCWLMVRSA